MAALLSSRMQSSFLGSSVQQRSFTTRRPVAASVVVRAAYGDLPKVGGGRKWVHTKVNQNGKPVKVSMHVKKGDLVVVIAGKDKGHVGEVIESIPKKGKVVVQGANYKTKNIAPKTKEEEGQQVVKEYPLHHSNVMHWSATKQVRSRVGYKVKDDGSKVRVLVKTGEEVPDKSFKREAPVSSSDAGSSETPGSA